MGGDLFEGTTGDLSFTIDVDGGTPSRTSLDWLSGGTVAVSVAESTATVAITAPEVPGITLDRADCTEFGEGEPGVVGKLVGSTLTLDVRPGTEYECFFMYVAPLGPWAAVGIVDFIDDESYDVRVTGGVPHQLRLVPNEDGYAGFGVDLDAGVDAARVEIRPAREGLVMTNGGCYDDATSSVVTRNVAGVIVLEVRRQGRYHCELFAVGPVGSTPHPTLPPTDTDPG